MSHDDPTDQIARAIRAEIVRQYRDDDRRKCPAGLAYWEQEIQPHLLAEVVIAEIRKWYNKK